MQYKRRLRALHHCCNLWLETYLAMTDWACSGLESWWATSVHSYALKPHRAIEFYLFTQISPSAWARKGLSSGDILFGLTFAPSVQCKPDTFKRVLKNDDGWRQATKSDNHSYEKGFEWPHCDSSVVSSDEGTLSWAKTSRSWLHKLLTGNLKFEIINHPLSQCRVHKWCHLHVLTTYCTHIHTSPLQSTPHDLCLWGPTCLNLPVRASDTPI